MGRRSGLAWAILKGRIGFVVFFLFFRKPRAVFQVEQEILYAKMGNQATAGCAYRRLLFASRLCATLTENLGASNFHNFFILFVFSLSLSLSVSLSLSLC